MSNSIRRTMSGYCKLNIRTNTNSICSWRRKINHRERVQRIAKKKEDPVGEIWECTFTKSYLSLSTWSLHRNKSMTKERKKPKSLYCMCGWTNEQWECKCQATRCHEGFWVIQSWALRSVRWKDMRKIVLINKEIGKNVTNVKYRNTLMGDT